MGVGDALNLAQGVRPALIDRRGDVGPDHVTVGALADKAQDLGRTVFNRGDTSVYSCCSLVAAIFQMDDNHGILLPQLTDLFAGIPLPSLEAQGIGLSPTEVALIGGGLEYVGFYGDLVILPPIP